MPFKAKTRNRRQKDFYNQAITGGISLVILVLCLFVTKSLFSPRQAHATHCIIDCQCVSDEHTTTRNWITVRHADTQLHIGNEFVDHRQSFLLGYFWNEHLLAALAMMTEQLVSVGMQQTLMVGAFLDAKHQSETIRLFQTLLARAHKDYHPDTEMCVIGTHSKSLAGAQRRGEAQAYILSRAGIRRGLNNVNTNAAEGTKEDKEGRLEVFKTTFCDVRDNGDALQDLCDGSGPSDMMNKDVDYTGLVDTPWTIDFDLTTQAATLQDAPVYALYQNLYGHNTFNPISADAMENQVNHNRILDIREIIAKRAVAQDSFASLIGQKARGSADSGDLEQYMQVLLAEFGIDDPDEISALVGERPSYYAQMEILSKQIFMREQFYTNLYDKPVNVDRKGAAIQAINLIQNVDLFESKLRNEAMLALLVEMELEKVQQSIQNRMNKLRSDDPIKITP